MTVIRVCYQICLNNSLSKVVQSMTSTFHITFLRLMFFTVDVYKNGNGKSNFIAAMVKLLLFRF